MWYHHEVKRKTKRIYERFRVHTEDYILFRAICKRLTLTMPRAFSMILHDWLQMADTRMPEEAGQDSSVHLDPIGDIDRVLITRRLGENRE